MLNEVNTILKEYLYKELNQPSDTLLDFSFNLPSKDWLTSSTTSKNWINIYLLELKENIEYRENSWRRQEKVNNLITKKKPPIYVDLYYLITFFNTEKKTQIEHEYLESVLISLYDFKSQSQSTNHNFDNALLKKIEIELFPKSFIDDNSSYQLWSSLNQDARPYIPIKITLPLDSKVETSDQIVRENGKTINLTEKV